MIRTYAGRRGPTTDDADDEQREVLRSLLVRFSPFFRRPVDAMPDHACDRGARAYVDQLFATGAVSPKSWSYLSFALTVLEAATPAAESRQWSKREHLWGYAISCSLSQEEAREFDRTVMPTLREAWEVPEAQLKHGGDGATESSREPLKCFATLCLRALVWERDYEALRRVILWAHQVHQVHLQRLIERSDDDASWLENLAELMPRLLANQLVPINDTVVLRDGAIAVRTGPMSSGPRGLHDPGTVGRVSTLFRNIFDETQLHALSQTAQHIEEVFAHTVHLLWSDRAAELGVRRQHLLHMAEQQGRLRALQRLETEYRHTLSIPTYMYHDLRHQLRQR